ncbi:hypothetical protein BASH2_04929 [Bacillus anthracis]|nr:hypothetical protein BASH2_04929 [Bacillus anthracis]
MRVRCQIDINKEYIFLRLVVYDEEVDNPMQEA